MGFCGRIIVVCVFSLVAIGAMNAYAVSASPDILLLTQPDGFSFEARMRGDEYVSWMETLDGYSIIQVGDEWFYAGLNIDEQLIATAYLVGSLTGAELSNFVRGVRASYQGTREKHTPRYIAKTGARAVTTQKILLVLVTFSDVPTLTFDTTDFEPLMFGASDSVKEFYSDNAYGNFNIVPATESSGTVNDGVIEVALSSVHPYDADKTQTYANVKVRIDEALDEVDASINFATYDIDASGSITADELSLVFIFAGNERALSGAPTPSIWGHKSSISPKSLDGVTLSPFTAFGEIHHFGSDHAATIGIMCHELGHLMLGLPDLYDTDGSSEGIGDWGLMAGGSWNRDPNTDVAGDSPSFLSAWSRTTVGFSTPTILTSSSTDTTIASAHATSDIKELWIDKYKSPLPEYSERFLVENRQQSGYDVGLPSNGLLIFHIDESQSGNTDETHKLVDLEEANNDGGLDDEVNQGDGGDPFPGTSDTTAFNGASTPNSNDYTDTATGIGVTNISASMETMTADFTPHATGGQGETLNHSDVDYNGSGSFGFTSVDNWTAIEHTNSTSMDLIEGFEIYCGDTTTIDFYFFADMTANVPTTQIGTEETGFVASAGWNRFLLTTPLSFPPGSTRVMVLKLSNTSTNYPRFVKDDSPNAKSWIHTAAPPSTFTYLVTAGFPDRDWRQHLLLGSTVIENLATAWVDFAWGGSEQGTEALPFNTLDEALAALADEGTIKIKGDTATPTDDWEGFLGQTGQSLTLDAINGTVTLGN